MIPLFDDHPTLRPAVVVWLLIIACALTYLWQASLPHAAQDRIVYSLGVIPAVLFGQAELPAQLRLVPAWASIFTSIFLHGSWLHLIGNMLYLWIFGDNVEDAMGRLRFVVFYLVCGAAAALGQSLAAPDSHVPMVGASGAIAGVLGAYVMLFPRANVTVLIIFVIFIRFVQLPAILVLGVWFALQLMSGAMTPTEGGGVAFFAHIAGFLTGMVLIPFFKDPRIRLFAGPSSRSFAVRRPRDFRRGSVPEAGEWRRRGPWGGPF